MPDPNDNESLPPVRSLTCCCCGELTRGRQWRNRDTGFGLCPACIPLCERNETPEGFASLYGERGIHFDIGWRKP